MTSTLLDTLPVFLASYLLISFPVQLVWSNDDSFHLSSFFTLRKDRYLPNHVIYSTFVTSSLDCSMQCNIKDDCLSWNMRETFTAYVCELNNVTMEMASQNNVKLLVKEGAQFGQRVSFPEQGSKPISFLFTSLGAQGKLGPSDVTGYDGTSLEGQVTLDNGIQIWKVPQTGTYRIEAQGASGANGTCTKNNYTSWQLGGLGAKMRGTFSLRKGMAFKILVGQSGTMSTAFGDQPGGGGGGTFVTFCNSTPLIIAGGGGGGGGCFVKQGMSDGDPGQQGELGSQCTSTLKQGGVLCPEEASFPLRASSGAGLLGDGQGSSTVPRAFVNGGDGGESPFRSQGSLGGFGGGGYGWEFGGGGGGYSGGSVWGNSTEGVAGGGGSFNVGKDEETGICDSEGDGLVKIDLIG